MAGKRGTQQPSSRNLTAEDLRLGLKKLQRRIDELESFDVLEISERYDQKIYSLTVKINGTLADIFGRDTPE